jgi:hypothetical protein
MATEWDRFKEIVRTLSWLDLIKTKFLPLRDLMIEDAKCVTEFVLAGPGVEFTPLCLIPVRAR